MKKYILLIYLACIATALQAQKVKYKDIFPAIVAGPEDNSFALLNAYIPGDLDHPNANLRMALIYRDRYTSSDYLTEYEKVIANAERAKQRFLKAKLLIDEKEIKRNDELYVSIKSVIDAKGKTLADAAGIVKLITDEYNNADQISKQLPLIYNAFTTSVGYYDQAIKIYANINGKYASLDELFMLYDNTLAEQLKILSQNYDSALHYFDIYKGLIASFPIPTYNQSYTIKPIQTYRLEGLMTQMDFLTNNLIFWNYKQWVNEINTVITIEIAKLRKNIEANERSINDGLANAATTPSTDFQPTKLDKETIFLLKKYDYQSIVVALLELKQQKQLLINKLQNREYYESAAGLEAQRKFTYYSDVINTSRDFDSLLTRVKQRNLEEKIIKHAGFINQYYRGQSGIANYIKEEDLGNKRLFAGFIEELKTSIINELEKDEIEQSKVLKYKTYNLPLAASNHSPDSVQTGAMLTTIAKASPDGSTYLAGTFRPDKKNNNLVAYIARIAADGKLAWLKEYNLLADSSGTPGNTRIGALELTKEGCAISLASVHPVSGIIANSFVYLSEKGEEKFTKQLASLAYPRKINYKESNGSFVIILKGETSQQKINAADPLELISLNGIGDLLWTRSWEVSGTIEDLVNLQEGYLMVGNYTSIKDQQGKLVRTRANEGQTNAYVIRIDNRGDQKGLQLFSSTDSYFVNKVVKVNDSNINLFGINGLYTENYASSLSQAKDQLVHIIIDSSLKEISSSL